MNLAELPLTISGLRAAYQHGVTVREVVGEVLRRAQNPKFPNVWIRLLSEEEIACWVDKLDSSKNLPLYGVPFAIKDNIELAGCAFTCGCPEFERLSTESAAAVERLIAAGAIPIGKTNMDQFATGLVGTRTPYGICRSVFDESYISGGSSSGSAVAVAAGMVTFALGTDTAGSGRVPAAFNHVVGLKPSCGVISNRGVFPACRSLDCVSVFAGTAADAHVVLETSQGFDGSDPYSRTLSPKEIPDAFRFGIPQSLEFFGDREAESLFYAACAKLEELGGQRVVIDFEPFAAAARLLYQGAWVAERRHALGEFLVTHGERMDPTVRQIISGADKLSAVDAFAGNYQLQAFKLQTARQWEQMDILFLPTTGTTYSIAQVQADPLALNTNLGYYTNFVNLLDLAAVAVPAGFRTNGLPFGVTCMGPAFTDFALLAIADKVHRQLAHKIGCTNVALASEPALKKAASAHVLLAVVGAHLTGQPLNGQLTQRGATFIETTRTATNYRLYALANTQPAKPGLVRVDECAGEGIEVELWSLSPAAFGSFVNEVPAPMAIGNATLCDGRVVKSFVCEPCALHGALDITGYGGWREYLRSKPSL